MDLILWAGLFIPLVGFILLMTTSLSRSLIASIGCGTILLSFICFLSLVLTNTTGDFTLFTWVPVQYIQADFSLHLDHLSLLMTLIITGVGFLIHLYSVGYMDHDIDLARYFAEMNFFIFSMLLLVLASNLLLLFVGWEGVGLASYLLIGYWYEKPEAAKAATKAFVVNRVGDFGLLLGLLLTFSLFGTGNIQEINSRVGHEFLMGAPIIALLAFLYFWGASGKSAQIPLHVWLPDAMEGPTPVSALIHAATMVTAGVYLVVRMHPVFQVAPAILEWVGYVGGATALFAALCATSQKDLKRVLAYSTVSQLGLMFLACGVQAYYAAMFHLTTHAFVKALLFLSAGNVIHVMHGETEMSKMGGLAKYLPKTNVCFLIGVLAMSGIPPLAIFFSKDLILEEEFVAGYRTLYYAGLTVSVLTAFYLTRAYILTFKGPSTHTTEEAPSVMLKPVMLLTLLSVTGGLLGFAINKPPMLMQFLETDSMSFASQANPMGFEMSFETVVSIIAALLGISVACLLYSRLKGSYSLFANSFYFDTFYELYIVRPMKLISKAITSFLEPYIFEKGIDICAEASNKTAAVLQRMQSGQIRSYISWIVLASALILIYIGLLWII